LLYQLAAWRQPECRQFAPSFTPVTKQGAIKLMQQLLEVGLVRRVGTRKSGRYILA
jgi:hypothetical protein